MFANDSGWPLEIEDISRGVKVKIWLISFEWSRKLKSKLIFTISVFILWLIGKQVSIDQYFLSP